VSARRRYLRQLTLNSNEARDTYRDDADDAMVEALRPLLDRAVAGEMVTLPMGEPKCAISARSGRGRALLVSLLAPPLMLCGGVDTFHLVQVAVAPSSLSGAFLRREWHSDGCSLDQIKPPTPWCAVELQPGMLAYPRIINWLDDFVACLAWAWIDRAPIASA